MHESPQSQLLPLIVHTNIYLYVVGRNLDVEFPCTPKECDLTASSTELTTYIPHTLRVHVLKLWLVNLYLV